MNSSPALIPRPAAIFTTVSTVTFALAALDRAVVAAVEACASSEGLLAFAALLAGEADRAGEGLVCL